MIIMTKTNKTLSFWFSWAVISGALLVSPSLVQADSTTTVETHCTTNSYGHKTCYDSSVTTEEESTIIAYVDEHVIVTPHEVLDTALTPAQIIALASVLCLGLTAVVMKLKTAKVTC